MGNKIIVIDFGAHSNQNIVRRIRELGVYSEMMDHEVSAETIANDPEIKGIVLADATKSMLEKESLTIDPEILNLNIPIIGVGYGMNLLNSLKGGNSVMLDKVIEGTVAMDVTKSNILLGKTEDTLEVKAHVVDSITDTAEDFYVIASDESEDIIAIANLEQNLSGVGFRLDVDEDYAKNILSQFVFELCGCEKNWSIEAFIEKQTKIIKDKVGTENVLLALSGGVDSSVVAALLHHAIGDQLTCIFVDHGLMRKGEPESVDEVFRGHFNMNLISVDAKDRFLGKLAGVSDPEQKRKIIGNEFIQVFDDETRKLQDTKWLAQGTIYADVLESGTKASEVIKSHHNVGGLPEDMEFKLIEPLDTLFKDEVREVGLALGLPEEMVYRQPFPGPGLGIRIIGPITKEKVQTEQEADFILREEFKKAGLDKTVWQYFVVLTDIKSVGVKNGKRTYESMAAIRGVNSLDGMKANWAKIPYEVLETISNRIIDEVDGINRVVYDITAKPPGTIEWE